MASPEDGRFAEERLAYQNRGSEDMPPAPHPSVESDRRNLIVAAVGLVAAPAVALLISTGAQTFEHGTSPSSPTSTSEAPTPSQSVPVMQQWRPNTDGPLPATPKP